MMEQLSHTQSATALVEDINANLQEMSSQVEVAVTDSAESLVGKLNTAFANVDGMVVLSKDADAETFVVNLNTNFEAAEQGGGGGGEQSDYTLPEYKSDIYGDNTTGEMKATLDDVESLVMNNGEFDDNNLLFVLSTDQHTDVSSVKPFAETIANQKKFIELAAERGINVTAVIGLGDHTNGMKMDTSVLKSYVRENITQQWKAINQYKPLLIAIGNHDNNVDSNTRYPCLTRNEIFDLYYKDAGGNILVDATGKNEITVNEDTFFHEYYKDYPTQKLRVIVLDCNIPNDIINNTSASPDARVWYFPPSSAEYLGKMFGVDANGTAINDQTDKMPNDYKLLVLSHAHFQSIGPGASVRTSTNKVIDLLKNHRESVLCMMCGHRHKDVASGWPIPALLTGCAKFEGGNGQLVEGDNAYYHVPARVSGSATADLWDVVIVNKIDNIVNTIRFGAGFNRRLHTDYIEVETGTTYTLTPSIQSLNGYTWIVQKSSSASMLDNNEDNTSYISVSNGVVSVSETPSTKFDTYLIFVMNSDESWQECWTIKVKVTQS